MRLFAVYFFSLWLVCSACFADDLSHFTRARNTALQIMNDLRAYSTKDLAPEGFTSFQPPNFLHNPGVMHRFMYRHLVNSQPRLIKVRLGPHNAVSDYFFAQEVFGMMLAARMGGPKIFRFGRYLEKGFTGYFVEMEQLFADDSRSVTLKGLRDSGTQATLLGRRPSQGQREALARMFVQAMRHRIDFGPDWDVMFSGDQAAWFDTADWTPVAAPGSTGHWFQFGREHEIGRMEDGLAAYAKALAYIFHIDRRTGDSVWQHVRAELKSPQHLRKMELLLQSRYGVDVSSEASIWSACWQALVSR